MIPLLLPCPYEGADELLHVLGERCNAKELLIAVQEASENLTSITATHDESDSSEDEELGSLSAPKQVIRLIRLYAESIRPSPQHVESI